MRKSRITAIFQADIQSAWNVVTDNENYAWRSDLLKVDIFDGGNRFIEYTKGGYSTTFTVIARKVCKRYEFDMENKNFIGHWTGIFTESKDGGTKINFTEELNIKNPIMEILSYLFMNLKKRQQNYVRDLRKKLGEQ